MNLKNEKKMLQHAPVYNLTQPLGFIQCRALNSPSKRMFKMSLATEMCNALILYAAFDNKVIHLLPTEQHLTNGTHVYLNEIQFDKIRD